MSASVPAPVEPLAQPVAAVSAHDVAAVIALIGGPMPTAAGAVVEPKKEN